MPINPKSSWPLTPVLVAYARSIDALPTPAERSDALNKCIERLLRAAAKLADHYQFPPDTYLNMVRAQLAREYPAAQAEIQSRAKAEALNAIFQREALEIVRSDVQSWLCAAKHEAGSGS